MIETEEQRRWWFATHPEYSWSRRGIRSEGGVDPEEVDKYVDEALKYETGHVADLLKSVKRNFGTESYSRGTLESEGPGWDTEAGGRVGPRQPPRPGRGSRRGLEIRNWFRMSRQERRARDAIENELEIAGANRHDYRYTSFAGKIVAQRDSTFDPYQRDMQGRTNIQRIREGLSPYDRDGERVVIHHANQSSEGPLIELTRAEHDSIRVRRDPTEIDRPDSRDFREIYWMARAASIRNPEPELFHYK